MTRRAIQAPRITLDMRLRIQKGEFPPGRPLPGRRILAETYGVALLTLQRALDPLLKDGTLRADSTRATYVSEPSTKVGSTPQRVALVAQSETDPSNPGEIWSARSVHACEIGLSAARAISRFYNVMHHVGKWWPDPQSALAAAAADNDAIIAFNPSEAAGWLPAVKQFHMQSPIPLVYVSGDAIPEGLTVITHDQSHSGKIAAEHCRDMGYERIVGLRPFAASWLDHRLHGAGTSAGKQWVLLNGHGGRQAQDYWEMAPGERLELLTRMTKRLLAGPMPLAIIAPNDGVGCEMITILEQAGLRPGPDVGIIGFDDTSIARSEGLTTMSPPNADLGAAAARMTLDILNRSDLGSVLTFPSRIIARPSTYLYRKK